MFDSSIKLLSNFCFVYQICDSSIKCLSNVYQMFDSSTFFTFLLHLSKFNQMFDSPIKFLSNF